MEHQEEEKVLVPVRRVEREEVKQLEVPTEDYRLPVQRPIPHRWRV